MWHEARKQEKKIRGMMVDYKRRAERRREYYERIKQDPAQFLQVHGRRCRIHLDPAIAQAADSPATMMPWQGHADNLIDRFDVRAHLDLIPEYKAEAESPKSTNDLECEERQANYERYRTLVQNDFFGLTEGKFLHQIYMEERFGPILKSGAEDEKKKLSKAAISYVYEDSSAPSLKNKSESEEEAESDNEDLSDIDFDVTVNVDELTIEQSQEMNTHALKYGMGKTDFISYLHQDKDEADQLKMAKEIEEEKAMYSGRKSRRERRALREKKLQGRKVTSPPSYAAAAEPPLTKAFSRSHSSSRSRSHSPENSGQVTFITSFGDDLSDEDKKSLSVLGPLKPNGGLEKPATTVSPPPPPPTTIKLEKLATRSEGKEVPLSVTAPKYRGRSSSTSSSSSRYNSRRRGGGGSRKKRHSSSPSSTSSSSSSSASSGKGGGRRGRGRGRRRRLRSSSSSNSSSSSRSRSPASRSDSSFSSQRKKSPSGAAGAGASQGALSKFPPPPVKSYYRHSLSRSGSEISVTSEEEEEEEAKSDSSHHAKVQLRKPLTLLGKAESSSKNLTPREKLQRKMRALLNKQYKMDKKAEMQKYEKQERERMDRAEELREMAIKLRQRERERRHRMRDYDRDSDSASSSCGGAHPTASSQRKRSPSRSASSSPDRSRHRHRRLRASPESSAQRDSPSGSPSDPKRKRSSRSWSRSSKNSGGGRSLVDY